VLILFLSSPKWSFTLAVFMFYAVRTKLVYGDGMNMQIPFHTFTFTATFSPVASTVHIRRVPSVAPQRRNCNCELPRSQNATGMYVYVSQHALVLSGLYTMMHERRTCSSYSCTAYMYHSVKIFCTCTSSHDVRTTHVLNMLTTTGMCYSMSVI